MNAPEPLSFWRPELPILSPALPSALTAVTPSGESCRGLSNRTNRSVWAPGGLVENLVDLDIHRWARRLKPAFDGFERKMNLGLFKPGYESEGGGGCAS
jgi:hypothetical protein